MMPFSSWNFGSSTRFAGRSFCFPSDLSSGLRLGFPKNPSSQCSWPGISLFFPAGSDYKFRIEFIAKTRQLDFGICKVDRTKPAHPDLTAPPPWAPAPGGVVDAERR